ncbi:MAG: HU family DNA-binding protein [Clostridia bacterium]|nr:HU family DNA-binding protein [Clostridia bacterium]
MNKTELVNQVSRQSKLSRKDCLACLNALGQVITQTLQRGEIISIANFGKFYTHYRTERLGINPQTGQTIKISAHSLPKFKPSLALKSRF